MRPIASKLFQQFRTHPLLNQIPPGKIILAVSGGADSVTLLHLCWRLQTERGWKLIGAHVQHHLRGRESLRDQHFVESLCRQFNIQCIVESIRIAGTQGIEEKARNLRYRSLARVAHREHAHTLLTAHTASDQIETFFMNLLRGAGIDGLSGIRPIQPLNGITQQPSDRTVSLVRPLLNVNRTEIESYLKFHRIRFCRDRSNRDLALRRNWIRLRLLPHIKTVQPQIDQRIADLMRNLSRERDHLAAHMDVISAEVFQRNFRRENGVRRAARFLDLKKLFRYNETLQKQFLHHIFRNRSHRWVSTMWTELKKQYSRGQFHIPLIQLESQRQPRHDPKSNRTVPLLIPGKTWFEPAQKFIVTQLIQTAELSASMRAKARAGTAAYFDTSKLNVQDFRSAWRIRNWKSGDRFKPFGMNGKSKKIQDFFVDEKISEPMRSTLPIVTCGRTICWVVGYRTADDARVDPRTQQILAMKVES